MFVSSINGHDIIDQNIIEGRLVTKFNSSEVYGYEAGTLVCEPVRENEDATMTDTVTRFATWFWDIGSYFPRTN